MTTTRPTSQPNALISGLGLMLEAASTVLVSEVRGVAANKLKKNGDDLRAVADLLFFIVVMHS
ncbi:MAG: hypothetical protein C0411_09725 [Pseudomonas sp.]|nr:hypothetical protein [Pseudomonas sp.]